MIASKDKLLTEILESSMKIICISKKVEQRFKSRCYLIKFCCLHDDLARNFTLSQLFILHHSSDPLKLVVNYGRKSTLNEMFLNFHNLR